MNTRRKILLLLLILCLVGLPALAQQGPGSIKIRFFKAGKADATLIRTEHHAILIDCAEEDDPQKILNYLSEKGIAKLDLLVLTHFDRGHIGGAPDILDAVPVDRVLMPDYEKDSRWTRALFDALGQSGAVQERVTEPVRLTFDAVELYVLPGQPGGYGEDEDDDFVLLSRLTHGENSFLLAGDIGSSRMAELIGEGGLESLFLQVPEHGRVRANTEDFIRAVAPRYVLITCSEKNPPAGAVLALLQELGSQTYLTMDGSITLTSDGYGITFEQ